MDMGTFQSIAQQSAQALIGYMEAFFPSVLLVVGFIAAVTLLIRFIQFVVGGRREP